MKLYLDDDIAQALLVNLLRRDGHDVSVPADFGMAGQKDAAHLRRAVREQAVFLSQNYDDFRLLHELILETQGHHPGILIVRKDNDPTRDMRPPQVVRALRNLISAGVPLADEYVILNHWR